MELVELNLLERRIEARSEGAFRRVWLSFTRLNSLQITIFTAGVATDYRIITRKNVPLTNPVVKNKNNELTAEEVEDRLAAIRNNNLEMIESIIKDGWY